METVPVLKKLLTSQSQRSASACLGSFWDSRAQENLHRPGSARPGGIRAPGLHSPHLQSVPSRTPSRTRRRGARGPRPPGQATAYRARRRRSSAGLHARVAGLTGWAGAGRGGRTGRTGRGCGPRSMPGNTSQGHAREAPPTPGSKRRALPTSLAPPGPRAQPRARSGLLAPKPSLCDPAAFFKRPQDGRESREPSGHGRETETRDRRRCPSGFLGESHAKWRGSRAGLKSESSGTSSLYVRLLGTESPEIAGSLGRRGRSDSRTSAQYLNPGFKLSSLLGQLKSRAGSEASWPTQARSPGCRGLPVDEWMRGARRARSGHVSI